MSSQVPAAIAASASAWPLWARVLIGRIEAGHAVEEARNHPGSRVSFAIIERAQRELPGFHAAYTAVLTGLRVLGPDAIRAQAQAYAVPVLADAYEASQEAEHEKDRVSNRRLLLESAGAVGPVARAPGDDAPVGLQLLLELRRRGREVRGAGGSVTETETTESVTVREGV